MICRCQVSLIQRRRPMSKSSTKVVESQSSCDDHDAVSDESVDIPDGYFAVVRYVQWDSQDHDHPVSRREPVVCPECSYKQPRFYEHGEDGVIDSHQLVTSGHEDSHTCCVNDACDYETTDSRQVRSPSAYHTIGPKRDYNRPRYEHSQHPVSCMRVKMNGGFEHAYDW